VSRASALLDTSAAVPLLIETHPRHPAVAAWARGKRLGLTGHSLAETYSVLTRLGGDARLTPADAAGLLKRRFAEVATLPDAVARALGERLAALGIGGGAVYDALVGLAAVERDLPLATSDRRARPTYDALGARVVSLGSLAGNSPQ
jgi:predicted nucleic acid-binding protein